ncbi:MAG: NAD(P)-dependent oxidoreductase [Microthrixaceae bacterium]
MKVFVTGGTGAIGRHAVDALLSDGHEVSALARSKERGAWLDERGARPVEVSIFDRSALGAAFAGHDAVVNLATALPSTSRFMLPWAWRENDRIRTEGSAAVADAARSAGVPSLVQESVCMLYADRGAEWIDEQCPVDRYPMAAGNHAAEANAHRFTESGGTGVVLRLGWFYGPGAAHSEEFFRFAERHLCPMIGRGDSYVSSIHVSDGGDAVAAALSAPAGVYNVVDDEPLTARDYAGALARAANTSAWLRAPGRAALLLGNRTTSLTRSLRVSNGKFQQATGWTPGFASAREGWVATAATLRQPHR